MSGRSRSGGSSAHSYRRREELKDRRRHIQTIAKKSVEEGHKAISTGDRRTLEDLLESAILPILELETEDLGRYEEIAARLGEPIDVDALRRLLREGVGALSSNEVHSAFASLETSLAIEGHIQTSAETEQRVSLIEEDLGIRYVRATSSLGGELSLHEPDDDLGAILAAGSQGAGKSTAVATIVEDRIQAGHKVIDLLDFHKGENCLYDVESKDDELRDWREKIGLPVGFEGDYEPPDVEIYVPLTQSLEGARIPVRETEDGEELVVRPFTVPASELSYRALVMVLPHTTKVHENYLHSAYQMLENSGEDWSLRDLAEAVRLDTNAEPRTADKIERSLETAQNKGFIRDKSDDHTLDWRTLMRDPETVTSFTVHMVPESLDKKMIVSYLLDKLSEVRDRLQAERRLSEYPPLTVVGREWHKVAPRNKSSQDSVKELEKYMIDTVSDLLAMVRHHRLEVVADTQRFYRQLDPDVSELFTEIFAFEGHKPDVSRIFNTRIGRTGSVVDRVSQFDTGICAHVSSDGYKLPIRVAPPRCHHLDARRDGSGIGFRARNLDDERLEPVPWSADVPNRLRFDLDRDPDPDDVEVFLSSRLKYTGDGGDRLFTSTITEVYRAYCQEEDVEPIGSTESDTHNKLHRRLKEYFDVGSEVDCMPVHPEHEQQKPAREGFKFRWGELSDRERDQVPNR